MSAFGNIKVSSILCGATEAEFDGVNNSLLIRTLDAAIGIDVSAAGSPGQLIPTGNVPGTGIARWVDRGSGITVGFPIFTMSVRPPSRESRVTRVQMKYVSPTMAVTSPATGSGIQPAPTKAYEISANIDVIIPEQATRLEKIKFCSRLISLFMKKINASDDLPTDTTGTPVLSAIVDAEVPY